MGLIELARFLQFRSVFCLRTLSVWSCSFRKIHSHHHEIFYRQEQASLPLLRSKKTPLHSKKRASPSVGGVASQKAIPKRKKKIWRALTHNGGIGKIAALPSFEKVYYFCRELLVGKCSESRNLANTQIVVRHRRAKTMHEVLVPE